MSFRPFLTMFSEAAMEKEKEFPERKNLRLRQHDYSAAGAYFVTICVKDRKQILSEVVRPVGVGAPDDPQISLTEIGRIVERNLLSSEKIPGVTIDGYVIMPEHIHAMIVLDPGRYVRRPDGSPRASTPTNQMLPRVVAVFKRLCNKEIGDDLFQRGYMEHIVRDRKDYETRMKYMYENPIRRFYGE